MRAVFFIGSLATGGAERQYAVMASALRQRGHEVLFLTMEDKAQNPDYLRLLDGIEVRVLMNRRWPGPLRLLQLLNSWRGVRRELLSFNADVIYAGLEWPDWLAARAAKGMKPRPAVVAGIRNSAPVVGWKRALPLKKLARHGGLDALVANSHIGLAVANGLGISAPLEQVIANGIDTDQFQPDLEGAGEVREEIGIPQDSPLIGHVGRLADAKDHPTLLEAFSIVAEKRSNAHFICVGHGSQERLRSLNDHVRTAGFADRFHWIPSHSNLPALYSALDMLVLSSSSEGFPNVVAEAMACETPCVVTNVGEAANIVGNFGRLAPPGDPESLAVSIKAMLDDPKPGGDARARIVEHFSISRMIETTEEMLETVIAAVDEGSD